MGIKDDILSNLGTIPQESPKPADNTNPDQQQIEKDRWGNILNTQTFLTYDKSMNILKDASVYMINNSVDLATLTAELLRLDNKNTSQDLLISSKVDTTTYTTKMADLDSKDTNLLSQINNLSNTYVAKTDYNTKISTLEAKDTALTTSVNSKVDTTTFNTSIATLTTSVSGKVDTTTYDTKMTALDNRGNTQDTSINSLQTNKADLSYVDNKITTLTSNVNSNATAITNLQTTKANISDVVLKSETNTLLAPYVTKTYGDGTYLSIVNANNNFVSLSNFNTSQSTQDNAITTLQNNKANKSDVYIKSEGDIRYVLRSEWNGGTGGGTGGTGADLSVYATWDSVYTTAQTYNKGEIDLNISNAVNPYLLKTDAITKYLSLDGGTLKGNLVMKDSTGTTGSVIIGNNTIVGDNINSKTNNSGVYNLELTTGNYSSVINVGSSSTIEFGNTANKINLKGSGTNPTYNNTDIALMSNLPNIDILFQGNSSIPYLTYDRYKAKFNLTSIIPLNIKNNYTMFLIEFNYTYTVDSSGLVMPVTYNNIVIMNNSQHTVGLSTHSYNEIDYNFTENVMEIFILYGSTYRLIKAINVTKIRGIRFEKI